MENILFFSIPGDLLRFHRVTRKRKQREIAPILGVDRTTYVGYEKLDEVKLTMDQAQKLAEFYGVTLEDFRHKVENVPRQASSKDGTISMPREVWSELKGNNDTYREFLQAYRASFDKLLNVVERTMDNLSRDSEPNGIQKQL